MDADAFEVLTQGRIIADDSDPSDLAEESIEFESHFSDGSIVVVDHFPFGNPGAPIPGMAQGMSSHAQFRATHWQGDSIWAPFQSKGDWEIAHWIKTCLTTSQVDGFLALGVCVAYLLNYHGPKSRL